MIKRFESIFDFVQVNDFVDSNQCENTAKQQNQQSKNTIKVRPIIPGPKNHYGKIQYVYPDSNGDTIHADKDTTGAVIYYISHDKIDSIKTINFSPKNARNFFKKQ